jgi:ribosomal protein S18 acetylase RimI-like enzyme
MTGIIIREFRYPADYALTIRLWQSMEQGVRVGPSDAPAEIEKKLERDPDLFLVAESEGGLAGTVIGGYDGRRGFVYHLAVAAPFRRSGLGSRLMNEVEGRLRRKGCIRSYLLVRPDNFEAMRHYQKLGWRLLDDQVFAKDLA